MGKWSTRNATVEERNALAARVNDLVKQGVARDLAEVMARVEIEYELITPVVNSFQKNVDINKRVW